MDFAECVDYALKNNITILNSDLDTQLTGVSKKMQLVLFLPNINGNASHSWNIGFESKETYYWFIAKSNYTIYFCRDKRKCSNL
jgi:hypothetical protein